MVGESYFRLICFSALVRELGKCDKQWLAMHLAEILASRVSLVAELNHDGASRGPVELAQQLDSGHVLENPPRHVPAKLTSSITTEKKGRRVETTVVPRAQRIQRNEAAKEGDPITVPNRWRNVKRVALARWFRRKR
jgi:hypothetical protein